MQARAGEAVAPGLGRVQAPVQGGVDGVWGSGRGRVLSMLGSQEAKRQCWSARGSWKRKPSEALDCLG